jgi:hypothetical protein
MSEFHTVSKGVQRIKIIQPVDGFSPWFSGLFSLVVWWLCTNVSEDRASSMCRVEVGCFLNVKDFSIFSVFLICNMF